MLKRREIYRYLERLTAITFSGVSRHLRHHVPIAAIAPMLFYDADIGHHHAPVDRLAHVVNGQEADLHGSERLHLDPGLAHGFHLRRAVHAVLRLIGLEIDGHARERQRMAQRHQVAGALGAHDGGDAGDAQHVAFPGAAGGDDGQRFRPHPDRAARYRDPVRGRLGGHVHHVGLADGVEMGQLIGAGAGSGRGVFCRAHG
jgi:hypothetical protein